jgi:hypothetical protein
LRNFHPCCFPYWLHCVTVPSTVHKSSNFSTALQTLLWGIFQSSHPSGGEVVSQYGFSLHFPSD